MAYTTRETTIYPSLARTTDSTVDVDNEAGYRGVILVIDMTVDPGTDTVTFTIQGKDSLSGKYYTILASTALTAVATTVLRVFPGSTVTANLAANDHLPAVWRIDANHSAATTTTYSVSAILLP